MGQHLYTLLLQAFVQHQQQEKRPLLSDNEEANELVSDIVNLVTLH